MCPKLSTICPSKTVITLYPKLSLQRRSPLATADLEHFISWGQEIESREDLEPFQKCICFRGGICKTPRHTCQNRALLHRSFCRACKTAIDSGTSQTAASKHPVPACAHRTPASCILQAYEDVVPSNKI